ncbi:hypothetical protein [Deinococcus sp.]|uniref:hypothetical protein n=1 Tax=Deinococcus sp. TaxID=47478 RepID=UPI0025C47D05|nr:hypothetical protein [Deinococcus sp.]
MKGNQSKHSEAPQSLQQVQTGWDIFAKAPKVEDFAAPERAKAGEISPRKTADFAQPLGE